MLFFNYAPTDNPLTISDVTSDMTITANFAPVTSVTVPAAAGGGTITVSTNTPGCGLYNVAAKTEAQTSNDPSYDYPFHLPPGKVRSHFQ